MEIDGSVVGAWHHFPSHFLAG